MNVTPRLCLIAHRLMYHRSPWLSRPAQLVAYAVNWSRGARRVRTVGSSVDQPRGELRLVSTKSDSETTCGYWSHAAHPDDELEFGGACPVQGDGKVDGLDAYYRARGTGWSFELTDSSGNVAWSYDSGRVYHFPDGGWLHYSVSQRNIERAVELYYAEKGRKL